ncbi:MAG TPA: hypothetical protein PLQ37_13625, partial [Acidiphilium sp.]|nr:hypothetical protein [Acidiphilium sp.]
SDPGLSDPGLSDPGLSDPGRSDPGRSDPGLSDPGRSATGWSAMRRHGRAPRPLPFACSALVLPARHAADMGKRPVRRSYLIG